MHLTFVYVSAILNCVYPIRSGTDQLSIPSSCFRRQILRITFKAPRVLVALKRFAIVWNTRQAKHGRTTTGQAKHVGIEPSLWKTFNLCTRLQYIKRFVNWCLLKGDSRLSKHGKFYPQSFILPPLCGLQSANVIHR